MNAALADAQALLCIGFGFNDDHLQGVIKRRLAAGMPAIIVTRDPTPNIEQLLGEHPHVIAVFKDGDGSVCHWNGSMLPCPEPLWKLDDFLKNLLSEARMSIFNFTDEQSLGEVRSVETSRITVRVTDGQRLQKRASAALLPSSRWG